MKTKLVPFNIEAAQAGAKIVTRCGRRVRIGFFDLKDEEHPIVGAVETDGGEVVCSFTKDGRRAVEDEESRNDAFKNVFDLFIEEEVEEEPNNFEIMPDKWYVCTLGWESCGWDGDWKFVEGSTYLGSEILQCYPMDEKEIQDHVRLWTICDAKPGDILATKNGYNILIFKNINSSSGSGFSSYYNYNNFSDYSDFKEGSWNRYRFTPATKEQRELLFQKMKEAGYEWDEERKELKKIAPKFKVDDKVVLKCDNSCAGSIADVSLEGTYCVKFEDSKTGWYSEHELESLYNVEKVKSRRMTNQELAWWLRDCPEEYREVCRVDEDTVYSRYIYLKCDADDEVPEYVRIRKNGGEWQEPLIEE